MEIQFLGTGAGSPSRNRNVTSSALKLLDERNSIWLFDCGEGTQQQILRTNISPSKIDKIFITHLHGDHIFGLPGFLSSRSFQGGDDEVVIYGPKGVQAFVETSLRISESRIKYKIDYKELDAQGGKVFEDPKFEVYALPLDHRILSFGYRVVEKDHPGELLVEKLKEFKIPSGPIYGKLKKGETVVLEDGRLLDGKAFIGPKQKGRIVTILGDTRKTDNSIVLALEADVLIHESTFGAEDPQMAHRYHHATSIQAAEIAIKANVGRLFLTHISARYQGAAALELQKEAAEVFTNVRVVRDFDLYDIPFDKKRIKELSS